MQSIEKTLTLIIGTATGLGTALAEALVARGQPVALDDPDANAIIRLNRGQDDRSGPTRVHNPNRAEEGPCDRIYEIVVQPPDEIANSAAIIAQDERYGRIDTEWMSAQLSARRPFHLVTVYLYAGAPQGTTIGHVPASVRAHARAAALSRSAPLVAALPTSQVLFAHVEADARASVDAPPSAYERLIAEALVLATNAQATRGDGEIYCGIEIVRQPDGCPLVQRD